MFSFCVHCEFVCHYETTVVSKKTRNKLSKFPAGEDDIFDSWKNINNHTKFRFRRYKTQISLNALLSVAVFLGIIVKVYRLLVPVSSKRS